MCLHDSIKIDVKQHKKHRLAKKKTERPLATQMAQIRNDWNTDTAGDEIKHDCLSWIFRALNWWSTEKCIQDLHVQYVSFLSYFIQNSASLRIH